MVDSPRGKGQIARGAGQPEHLAVNVFSGYLNSRKAASLFTVWMDRF
jgi:hypothetical protein